MDATESDHMGVAATIIGSVFAGLIGFGVGVITTFTHLQFPPIGILAGLTIVAALLVGFRLLFASRIIAGAAAVGILLAIALLALPGAGGSVVVADGLLGYLWVFGPPAIAVVVLVWPGFRRQSSE